MINRPMGDALQWWLEQQGKYKSGVFRLDEGQIKVETDKNTIIKGDGTVRISEWNADIPTPTMDELSTIIDSYEQYLQDKANAEQASLDSAKKKLTVLGLTADEIAALMGKN